MRNVFSRVDSRAVQNTSAAPATRTRRDSRIGPWRDVLNVVEWSRYLTELLVLVPAARLLPLRVALALAYAAGLADMLMPTAASRSARIDMRSATGLSGRALFRVAARHCATRRRALVYTVRVGAGRDEAADWRTIEAGTEVVRRLLAGRRSFILAGIHSWAPPMFRTMLVGGAEPSSVRADTRWHLSPFVLRTRLRNGTRQRARARLLGMSYRSYLRTFEPRRSTVVPNLWRRDANWAHVPERTPQLQDGVVAKLAVPGSVVFMAVDAFWDKPGAHRRQFVGSPARGFALGAARIARVAQCPIVPFVAALGDELLTAHVECGPLIEPPAIDDKGADPRTLDQVLDWLELAIARYPTEYADHIGWERSWDPSKGRWV